MLGIVTCQGVVVICKILIIPKYAYLKSPAHCMKPFADTLLKADLLKALTSW